MNLGLRLTVLKILALCIKFYLLLLYASSHLRLVCVCTMYMDGSNQYHVFLKLEREKILSIVKFARQQYFTVNYELAVIAKTGYSIL